jgi:two-component system sensor histidine kinase KdpD
LAVIVIALAVASAAAAFLEAVVGLVDASPVYLVAVVLVAGLYGTWAAVGTSVAAFFIYDFLFTSPRFTLAITDPAEWLSLLLFLMVAVAIGRLTALLRERADEADRRVRESVSLVGISRETAMATTFEEAARAVVERLAADTEMAGLRIATLDEAGRETVVASEGSIPAPGESGRDPWTLLRDGSGGTSDWVRIVSDHGDASDPSGEPETYRIPIDVGGRSVGVIDAFRAPGDPRPGRGARRILSLAADQLGIAAARDALREELTAAEVGRRSEALRGAILDSVSHDLRTPIATIRALAGSLADPDLHLDAVESRNAAAGIDREADRLAGLVGSLLDMSRIQAGAVRPDVEPYDVAELVETAVRRIEAGSTARLVVAVPADIPPVSVDAVLFDVAFGNVLENAVRYAPIDGVRVTASLESGSSIVALTVDDAGPGVPADALPRLFDRFYRVPGGEESARRGLGMGLAIARGFAEAMGATVEAGPSELGGLRVTLRLPSAGRRATGGVA